MNERRYDWKENISKQAQERAKKRQSLLVQLESTREEIKSVGLDFAKYDELKVQQREIITQLAIL